MQPSLEKSNAENLGKFSRLKEDIWMMDFSIECIGVSLAYPIPFSI